MLICMVEEKFSFTMMWRSSVLEILNLVFTQALIDFMGLDYFSSLHKLGHDKNGSLRIWTWQGPWKIGKWGHIFIYSCGASLYILFEIDCFCSLCNMNIWICAPPPPNYRSSVARGTQVNRHQPLLAYSWS